MAARAGILQTLTVATDILREVISPLETLQPA
jgi:hypothetical protein